MVKKRGRFWFWALPPIAVIAAAVCLHRYGGEWFGGEAPEDETEGDRPEQQEQLPHPPPPPPVLTDRQQQPDSGNLPPLDPGRSDDDVGAEAQPQPFTDIALAQQALPELVRALSSRPELIRWLKSEHLLYRFVYAVDCVANNFTPISQIEFYKLKGPFQVTSVGGRTVASTAAFKRYDLAADVFCSLDAVGSAQAYRRLEPVFERIYRDKCKGAGSFRNALARAIGLLLQTPSPAETPSLTKVGEVYVYVDNRYEKLPMPQKDLLRMGPDNVRRVQAKLRELAAAIKLKVE